MPVPWRKPTLWELGPELGIDLQVPWFDVTDNRNAGGAKGDGVTDDTAAVQAAINAAGSAGGGRVVLPAGTFLCGQLSLASNVTIEGTSRDLSIIKVKNGLNNHLFNTSVTSLSNVHLRNMAIDGNKANQTTGATGVNFILYDKSSVVGCRIFNTFFQAIRFGACTNSLIAFNNIETPGTTNGSDGQRAGIALDNSCNRIRIIGNHIDSPSDSGIIMISGNERISIVGNTVKSPTYIGIALSGSSHVTCTGNVIDSSVDDGIDGGLSTFSTISGNAMYNCGQGISCDSGSKVTITGNTIDTTTKTDAGGLGAGIIFVNGTAPSKHVSCTNNIVRNAAGHGIVYDNIQEGVIANNIVANSAQITATCVGINITSTHGDGSKQIIVTGNRCYDDQGGKTQAYGLAIGGTNTANITVAYNDFTGNLNGPLNIFGGSGGHSIFFSDAVKSLTYSASISTDASTGTEFTIVANNGTAFTINNPTNAQTGLRITYDIKNTSGGAMGAITWGAAFLLAGAFTNPATGKRRTITFYYDGTNWVETNRAAADI